MTRHGCFSVSLNGIMARSKLSTMQQFNDYPSGLEFDGQNTTFFPSNTTKIFMLMSPKTGSQVERTCF